MTGHPIFPAKSTKASWESQTCQRGLGNPARSMNWRMTALSWACTWASAPGRTATPVSSMRRTSSVGTCSWSNVTASQSLAKASTASSSRCDPTTTSFITWAADSCGEVASSLVRMPSPMDA